MGTDKDSPTISTCRPAGARQPVGTGSSAARRSGRHSVQRERGEAQALIALLALRWWAPALHHSPNEEMNATARQLAASQGTKPGFPDYILPIAAGGYVGCVIELKAVRPYGRRETAAQASWLAHFRAQGWQASVCYGADDALATLEAYMARWRSDTKK